MEESKVLLDNWEEGDYGRLEVLIVKNIAVFGHISGRVKEVLKVLKELLILAGKLFPGASQSGDRGQIQATARQKKLKMKTFSFCKEWA